MAFKKINDNLYINEDNVANCYKLNNKCYLDVVGSSALQVSEDIYDEIKEYEGGGGGSGGGSSIAFKNIVVSSTDWEDTSSTGDEGEFYELGYVYKALVVEDDKVKEAKDGFVVFEDDTADDPNFCMDILINKTDGKVYIFAMEEKEAEINRIVILTTTPVDPFNGKLNITFSDNVPSDTSKIWIKCGTPDKVVIETIHNAYITEDESLMQLTKTSLSAISYTGEHNKFVLLNDSFYIAPGSYWNGSSLSSQKLYKANKDTLEIEKEVEHGITNSNFYIFQENEFIYLFAPPNYQQYYYNYGWNIKKYDKDLNLIETYNLYNSAQLSLNGYLYYFLNECMYIFCTYGSQPYYYKFDCASCSYTKITLTNGELPASTGTASGDCVMKDNKFYFLISASRSERTKFGYLYYIDISTNKIEYSGIRLSFTDDNNISRNPNGSSLLLQGNNLICYNIIYSYYDGTSTTAYCHDLLVYNLETLERKVLLNNVFKNVSSYYGAQDKESGKLYFIYDEKIELSSIYKLDENVLELYYDKSSNKEVSLLNLEQLVITTPINHAWLGDEDDIAQPVDMFIYENNLWKGINCLGWTQLKSCTIAAENVAIDLYTSQSNTQTITITPTWANTAGTITSSVASSNTSLATCSLSGNSLVVNALAVGTPTITITVVDQYGTKFTKSITVTITDTTPTE